MKKLMVMLAVAAVAVCSQASTASWTAAQVYDGSTIIPKGSGDYCGLLCLYTADSGVSSSSLASYLASDTYTTAEKIAKINAAALADSKGTVSTSADGLIQLPAASAATAPAGSYTAYAILFDVSDISEITDSTRYYITNEIANQVVPTAGNKLIGIGSQKDATMGKSGAWTAMAVPEPTSGLLLLLGVAGLALRRRRA